MKITKRQLQNIIKEELELLTEEESWKQKLRKYTGTAQGDDPGWITKMTPAYRRRRAYTLQRHAAEEKYKRMGRRKIKDLKNKFASMACKICPDEEMISSLKVIVQKHAGVGFDSYSGTDRKGAGSPGAIWWDYMKRHGRGGLYSIHMTFSRSKKYPEGIYETYAVSPPMSGHPGDSTYIRFINQAPVDDGLPSDCTPGQWRRFDSQDGKHLRAGFHRVVPGVRTDLAVHCGRMYVSTATKG